MNIQVKYDLGLHYFYSQARPNIENSSETYRENGP